MAGEPRTPNLRGKAQALRSFGSTIRSGATVNMGLTLTSAFNDTADAFDRVQDALDILMSAVSPIIAASTAAAAGGTGSGTAPAAVSIGTITAVYRDLPDAYGNILLDVVIPYTKPIGWTGTGVHLYYEYPDQSTIGTTTLALDGSTALDGVTTTVAGAWSPQDGGKFPTDFGATSPQAFVRNIVAPRVSQVIRVYLVAYGDGSDPKPVRATATNPSPNATFTIQAPATRATGIEYAPNLTNFAATAGASFDRGDGKQVTPITCTFDPPTDTRIAGVWFEAIWDSNTIPADRHSVPASSLVSGTFLFRLDTPAVLHVVTIYARSFNADGKTNVIVPGITPAVTVQVGSLAGTLDLTKTILSSVAAHFDTATGVFAIKPLGITTSLINGLAVTSNELAAAAVITSKIGTGAIVSSHIQNAQITNALIANLAVGTANIQAAAVTTALIATAAITTALINDLAVTDAKIGSLSATKITAGTINSVTITTATINGGAITGTSLVLSTNGATAKINNGTQSGVFSGPAITLSDNGTSAQSFMQVSAFAAQNTAGSLVLMAYMAAGGPALSAVCSLYNQNGNVGAQLQGGSSASNPILVISGNQVVGARQTGPGNSTDATDVATRFNNLLTNLRTHGLIT